MTTEAEKSGHTWHMYHDHLLSWCDDYDWRVRSIKNFKPQHEIQPRLRRFKFVKGKLPDAITTIYDNRNIHRLMKETQ